MANHAYLYPKFMPPLEEIYKNVSRIVRKKFLGLSVKCSILERRINVFQAYEGGVESSGIEFWLSEKDGRPCIEFRHSHDGRFWWWVEYEIQEFLACIYYGTIEDDALPGEERKFIIPRKDFRTYRDYLLHRMQSVVDLENTPGWKERLNTILDNEREMLPTYLKSLIGDNVS